MSKIRWFDHTHGLQFTVLSTLENDGTVNIIRGEDSMTVPAEDVDKLISAINKVRGIVPAPDTERDKLVVSLSDRLEKLEQRMSPDHPAFYDAHEDVLFLEAKTESHDEILGKHDECMTDIDARMLTITDRLGERIEAISKDNASMEDGLGHRISTLEDHLDDLIKAFDVHVGIEEMEQPETEEFDGPNYFQGVDFRLAAQRIDEIFKFLVHDSAEQVEAKPVEEDAACAAIDFNRTPRRIGRS